MSSTRLENATRNIIFGFILKVYQIILPFVIRTALIYILGMEYVGLNSLFGSVLQVLNLTELGIGSAMIYSMYKPIIEHDTVKICALLNLYRKYYRVIGFVVGVIGISIIPILPRLISGKVTSNINIYILYGINLLTTVLSYWLFSYKNSLFIAHQRMDVMSKITLLTNSVQYILQLGLLLAFKNYYLFIIVTLITQILNNLLIAVKSIKLYPEYRASGKLDKESVKVINQRVKDLFTAKFGSVIVSSVDSIVISMYLGLTVLAVYQNYYYVITVVMGFITIIFSSCTAAVGNSLVVESINKNYNDFKKMTFIITWIISVASTCFMCLYQPFMKIWVGTKNCLNIKYVILFVIYFIVCELSMIWATYKDAAGMWHNDRFRPLIGATGNLVMNIVLVNYIGLYGILLSTIISYVLISMPWLIRNLFKYLFKRNARSYILLLAKYIVICFTSCLLSYLICSKIEDNGFFVLIIKFIICMILSNLLFILCFYKTYEFKGVLQMFGKIVKRGCVYEKD